MFMGFPIFFLYFPMVIHHIAPQLDQVSPLPTGAASPPEWWLPPGGGHLNGRPA